MNQKVFLRLLKISGFLSLVLGTTIVLSSFTQAWFSDKAVSPNALFTSGTVAHALTDTKVKPDTDLWFPGECKYFTWTMANTGSKKAYFRARLIETDITDETAWGNGTRFPSAASWGMYFTFDPARGKPKTVDLIAGQHHRVGSVKVQTLKGALNITYSTLGDWRLTETHLAVANSLSDIPINAGGNPVPGRFPYAAQHQLEEEYTYRISGEPNLKLNKTLYIAAHAVVVDTAAPGRATNSSVHWSLTNVPGNENWVLGKDGWWYHCQPIAPDEGVSLSLTGCLDPKAAPTVYNVQLEVEAIQSSHNTINHIWPEHPCGGRP